MAKEYAAVGIFYEGKLEKLLWLDNLTILVPNFSIFHPIIFCLHKVQKKIIDTFLLSDTQLLEDILLCS